MGPLNKLAKKRVFYNETIISADSLSTLDLNLKVESSRNYRNDNNKIEDEKGLRIFEGKNFKGSRERLLSCKSGTFRIV